MYKGRALFTLREQGCRSRALGVASEITLGSIQNSNKKLCLSCLFNFYIFIYLLCSLESKETENKRMACFDCLTCIQFLGLVSNLNKRKNVTSCYKRLGLLVFFLFPEVHWKGVKYMLSSHRRTAKALASLYICAVLPEPLLFAQIIYGPAKSQRFSFIEGLRMRVWRNTNHEMRRSLFLWVGSVITCWITGSWYSGWAVNFWHYEL